MKFSIFAFIFFLVIPLYGLSASEIDDRWLTEHYTKREVMIPMRDGISLFTAIYEPLENKSKSGLSDAAAPLIMMRTPYSIGPYGQFGFSSNLRKKFRPYLENGYVVVLQNVRGRFLSEGLYENIRPFIADKRPGQTDEASDTYDTVEWLLHNVYFNGAVGVTGVSYPGFYATLAALSGHPAIKAVSPQAPVLDWYMGDDAHHNGVLMLADTYSFGGGFYRYQKNPATQAPPTAAQPIGDLYSFFMRNRTFQDVTETLADTLSFWNEIRRHPDYDDFWKARTPAPHLKDIKPAVLVVGGSFDTDDCYGAVNTFKLIKKQSPETDLHFIYGPWYHGGWHNSKYENLGQVWFGEGFSDYYMYNLEYPFFRYYLEGKGERPESVYVMPSGVQNAGWETYDTWPPKTSNTLSLYFSDNGTLSYSLPDKKKSFSEYISDPSTPVPYYWKPQKSRNKDYMCADQRFASCRSDVLTFTTDILADTLKVEGPVKVRVYCESTSSDMDIVVKLIDVYPDDFAYPSEIAEKLPDPDYMMGGYQMLVRGDIFRARYRKRFEEPVPMVPGKPDKVDFTMPDIAHYFLPGHRVMVQVQSSWFPLADINPQKFVKNIYEAVPEDYTDAEIKIYHQKNMASYIELPIVQR